MATDVWSEARKRYFVKTKFIAAGVPVREATDRDPDQPKVADLVEGAAACGGMAETAIDESDQSEAAGASRQQGGVPPGCLTCRASAWCKASPGNDEVIESEAYLHRAIIGACAIARRERLRRRAISRFMQGSKFERLLLVTLTTSPDFKGDLHDAWRKFMWRCRRRGLWRSYFAVREYNEAHTCEHLHVVFQVRRWLDIVGLRREWKHVTGARWVYCEWVRNKGGTASYLAKYMLKAYGHAKRGRTYWYALSWVFPGFVRFSKAVWAVGSGRSDKFLWQVRQGGEDVAHRLIFEAWDLAKSLGVGVRSIGLASAGLAPYPLLRKGGVV